MKVQNKVHVHFIGIGGIGMSGIAEILLSLGFKVSGSDLSSSPAISKLESLGAKIFQGHKKENVEEANIIVHSSAIQDENPEMVRGRELKIPLMKRAHMLAELMRLKKGIAVAGTHGKTTTTSFLATILQETNNDPTYIIGGIVKNLNGHAKMGSGDILVAEADESDGSFLLLNPLMSVITNIDYDHMEYYENIENVHEAFLQFANKIPFYGVCSLNIHDPVLMKMASSMEKPWTTYGVESQGKSSGADFEARNISQSWNGAKFDLFYKGELKTEINLSLPGRHNILNALGAISIAYHVGISFEDIARSIEKFKGVGRRFQHLLKYNKVNILDDYAHHPTEIMTTIETLRGLQKKSKVVVVFEPHRFSRTKDCWNQFLHCFNSADKLYLCPVYPASEGPIPGITSNRLASDINNLHPNFAEVIEAPQGLMDTIIDQEDGEATYLFLGAGSIGKNVRNLVESLENERTY